MNFRNAILKVIEHEGGAKITENKLDPGGLTKYGISQRAYPGLDIRGLTLEKAVQIYKKDYWDVVGGDKIKSYAKAFLIFDQAVNRGPGTALKQAQQVLGISQTGRADAITIDRLNSIPDGTFSKTYLERSADAYRAIVAKNPSQSVFLKGWLNRVSSLEKYISGYTTTVAISSGLLLLGIAIFFLIQGSGSHKARRAV